MVVLTATALMSAMLIGPATASRSDIDRMVAVWDSRNLLGQFHVRSWSVEKVIEGGRRSYAWTDPHVRWTRYSPGTRVKWNVRPYCHKWKPNGGREVHVTGDYPLSGVVTRGPSTKKTDLTVGKRRRTRGFKAGIGYYCSVIRLHIRPYVYSKADGRWHPGRAVRNNYIRVRAK